MAERQKAIDLHEISFPHPIDAEEVYKLLEHATNTGNYSVTYYGTVLVGRIAREEGKINHERYSKEISGVIWRGMNHATFNLERALSINLPDDMFKGVTFSPLGLDFDEIDDGELEIWKSFGKYVQQYFQQKE